MERRLETPGARRRFIHRRSCGFPRGTVEVLEAHRKAELERHFYVAGRRHGELIGKMPMKQPYRGGSLSASDLDLPERVVCPFCGRTDTELHAPFGTALSVATYWCGRCRTAFEWIKWDGPVQDRPDQG